MRFAVTAFSYLRPGQTNVLSVVLVVLLAFSSTTSAQTNSIADDSLHRAQQLLQTARTKGTSDAFQEAEDLLDQILQTEPNSIKALLLRGQARLEHSGFLAKQGKFDDSGRLTKQATEDFDRAVSIDPQDLQARSTRGSTYSQFPSFMNKGATAIEDLNASTRNAQFTSLKTESQARIYRVLGRTYAADGQPEKAAEAFRNAVKANAQSPDGITANEELEKLSSKPVAVDSRGNRRPDRFSQLASDTSPIIVAATFTVRGHRGGWSRSSLPASLQTFLNNLQKQSGMLGMRMMEDIEKPGMLIIMTWWQDKKALNDWFYSDTHQGLIKEYYTAGANQSSSSVKEGDAPLTSSSQVGMELFTTLPGGLTYGGGLTPPGAEKKAPNLSKETEPQLRRTP